MCKQQFDTAQSMEIRKLMKGDDVLVTPVAALSLRGDSCVNRVTSAWHVLKL